MTEVSTSTPGGLEVLASYLALQGYRPISNGAEPSGGVLSLENPAAERLLVTRLEARPGRAPAAAVAILNAQNRQIDVEDWLVANGLAGAVRFRAAAAQSAEVFFARFAEEMIQISAGPMREIIAGQAWSEPPLDRRGLRRRDEF